MKRFVRSGRKAVTALVVVVLFARSITPAYAESPVLLKKFEGAIDLSAEGAMPFALHGTASHLGQFTCLGEVEFRPGPDEGTLVGDGVAAFTAANGDLLVGVVTWEVGPEADGFRTTRLHFSWRDSVQFSDGTVVSSTGHFLESRPPGLVVIAIIAILIGLILPPAVMKVR
jgi:hypothetical protein